jgi:ABC-type multidrug transport system ATPase subunit
MHSRPHPTEPAPVLQARHIHFAHPGQAPLLSDWSATLMPGLTALQGDMGSGKTTVLRVVAGEWPCQGELLLQGVALADAPEAYRRQVCWAQPRDEALDALNPAEVLAALERLHGNADRAAWQRHIDGFGLAPHAHKAMYMLSTGSRQKAVLAAALSLPCALTLLDEPTTGLDAASIDWLEEALVELAGNPQRAVLLVCSRGLESLPLAGTITLPSL